MTLLLVPGLAPAAPAVEEAILPPAAALKIDFARDIKPILADHCLRCHGPERPKSGFRLTDAVSALKGGANGIDILPGKSAASPLIHYVARVVPDLEMPPEGKGEPLTTNQVGLLRAWIDQGAGWDSGATVAASSAVVSPVAAWTGVRGSRAKFQELEWQPEGWNGGLGDFQFRQQFPDGRTKTLEGHFLRDDYRVTLGLRQPDLGFARFGFEQFRKYYDDSGGYYHRLSPSLFHSEQDPHLDIGRAWSEVGLTLPGGPRIVAGYEYQFKQGSKSMLTWGSVQSPSGNFLDIRNFYPSVKAIDEHTHVVRLEISYDAYGFQLDNQLRLEFYGLTTIRTDALDVSPGRTAADLLEQVQERHHYTQVANTTTLQKELAPWWFAGIGYRYSWLDGDASLRLAPQDGAGRLGAASAWSTDQILLNEVWQVFNAHSQFRPLPNLTATLGVQGQWKQQHAFGEVNLDEVVDPTDPTAGIFRYPATQGSTLDQTTAEEDFLTRYAGIPFTSLYGEVKLKQEDYERSEDQHGVGHPAPHDFDLGSGATVRWLESRVGFSTSPWRWISFGGHYLHRDRRTDYAYSLARHDGAYPGFILERAVVSDEFEARVTLHPLNWLKAVLSYQLPSSDYRTTTGSTSVADVGSDATPGGEVFAGHYQAHIFNASASFTPFRRLFFSTAFGYQTDRTTTADHGSPAVVPYRGDLWTAQCNATYVVSDRTDLTLNYVFSEARYGQHNAAAGLPLGVDYDRHGVQIGLARRFSKALTGRLNYGYLAYDEPSSGHLRDFTAHQVMAVINFAWL